MERLTRGEFGEVAGVGHDYGDAQAAGAVGDQGVVCLAAFAKLSAAVLGGESGQDLASMVQSLRLRTTMRRAFAKSRSRRSMTRRLRATAPGVKFLQNCGA
jgi:hypothetical protein